MAFARERNCLRRLNFSSWAPVLAILLSACVTTGCERPEVAAVLDPATPAETKSITADDGTDEEAVAQRPADIVPAAPEIRFALVLTVEDYPALPGPLANPHEDGERVAAALSDAGFKVRHVTDPTARDIETEIETLVGDLARSPENSVGFVYYSGHGGSVDRGGVRKNYILPSKTSIGDGQELAIKGVRISELLEDLETAQAKAVFVVIDACRNTLPITSEKGGQADKGFIPYEPKAGLFVAFAVADGETTPDDGLYSTELSKTIRRVNISHDRAFTLANRAVAQQRPSRKTPVASDGLNKDIVFIVDKAEDPVQSPANIAAAPFTYFPPGSLLSNSGAPDRTVWAPDIAFPIREAPAYLGSQIFSAGGSMASGGNQCTAANYVYPWIDNFCESRNSGAKGYNCPTTGAHQGSDIRAGDVATCLQTLASPSSEHTLIDVVAVEDGLITQIGAYSLSLRAAGLDCDATATVRPGALAQPPATQDTDGGEDKCSGRIYRYLHLNMSKLKVAVGNKVTKGQVIGHLSNDFGGSKTTLHLHFEIKANIADKGWQYVSPYMSLVRAYERDRKTDGIMLNAIQR